MDVDFINKTLEDYEKLKAAAQSLCDRWVKAVHPDGYYANFSNFDLSRRKIVFYEGCVDGVGRGRTEISLDYLFNDEGLEVEAKNNYKKECDKRAELIEEERKLRGSGDFVRLQEIQRELNLNNYLNWSYPSCSPIYITGT